MKKEIWKILEGYCGHYEVSSFGRVRSIDRQIRYYRYGNMITSNHKGRILSTSDNRGYRLICLYQYGKLTARSVHRLVASAFIKNPENKPEVNHKDGNKINNMASNLEWATTSENQIHAYKNGFRTPLFGENNVSNRYTEEQICIVKRNPTMLRMKLSEISGVSVRTIEDIRSGKNWSWLIC